MTPAPHLTPEERATIESIEMREDRATDEQVNALLAIIERLEGK